MSKLKPVNDKIVVKPNKKNEEEVTASGIVLPDTVDQGKLLESLTPNTSMTSIRQLLANNSVTDYNELYKLLYDEIETYSHGKEAECILAIAEGQYQDVQVVDKEINFMSTIVKLLRIIR